MEISITFERKVCALFTKQIELPRFRFDVEISEIMELATVCDTVKTDKLKLLCNNVELAHFNGYRNTKVWVIRGIGRS